MRVDFMITRALCVVCEKVSRQSQWEAPKDFKLDLTKDIKDGTFGMSFYH